MVSLSLVYPMHNQERVFKCTHTYTTMWVFPFQKTEKYTDDRHGSSSTDFQQYSSVCTQPKSPVVSEEDKNPEVFCLTAEESNDSFHSHKVVTNQNLCARSLHSCLLKINTTFAALRYNFCLLLCAAPTTLPNQEVAAASSFTSLFPCSIQIAVDFGRRIKAWLCVIYTICSIIPWHCKSNRYAPSTQKGNINSSTNPWPSSVSTKPALRLLQKVCTILEVNDPTLAAENPEEMSSCQAYQPVKNHTEPLQPSVAPTLGSLVRRKNIKTHQYPRLLNVVKEELLPRCSLPKPFLLGRHRRVCPGMKPWDNISEYANQRQ